MGNDSKPKQDKFGIWIREDGAICVGDECLILKPNGKDLRIQIKPDKCGEVIARKYLDTLKETIGIGGNTIYEVPSELEHPGKQSKEKKGG